MNGSTRENMYKEVNKEKKIRNSEKSKQGKDCESNKKMQKKV